MYYYPLQPPYILLAVGLLAALTCGSAFAGTLKLVVQKWSSDRTANAEAKFSFAKLVLPFLGITVGVALFLCSGLEIFGFPADLAYSVALPMTLILAVFVWRQLGSMLSLVERQGFQTLDIDSWGEG